MGGFCVPGSGVAVFDLNKFLTRYPEFSQVPSSKLTAYFTDDAGLYLNNTPCSPVQDVSRRLVLLNMLVAHLSYLQGDLDAISIEPAPVSVEIPVTAPTAGPFVISHGLGVVPDNIDILATSAGALWQTQAADAQNLYLSASDVGVTATVSVFQNSQVSQGNGAPRPVGRTSSATEGSVSASFDFAAGAGSESAAFFNQSQYGAAFWQATLNLRSFRYVAGPNPGYPMRPAGYWPGMLRRW